MLKKSANPSANLFRSNLLWLLDESMLISTQALNVFVFPTRCDCMSYAGL